MAGKLDGKVAVITGGNSGLGLATAVEFIAEGAFVFITGRREQELNDAARKLGVNAFPVPGDVTKPADLDRLYATVQQAKGKLDILFANAGAAKFAPMEQVTEDQFDGMFNLNVRGLFFTVQKALPLMSAGGSIILNASVAGSSGTAGGSVYCATKAAVRSFARTWSMDLKGRNIRVNAVSPGMIPTPGYDLLGLSPEQVEGMIQSMTADIPMGRVGRPAEVARAVVFLASEDSSYVAGAELFVDGGLAQI